MNGLKQGKAMVTRAMCLCAAALAAILVVWSSSPAHADPASDLFAAIRANDAQAVDSILTREPSAVNAAGPNDVTPLIQAAYLERPLIVERLRRAKRELNFYEACIVGDMPTLQVQLARGQNVNALSPDGFPPLGLAVFFRQLEAARLLIESGADVNARAQNTFAVAPIHAAVARSDIATLQLLLLRGADPNLPQQRLLRPLHEAAAAGSVPIVAMLLSFGADPMVISEDGRSAADFARASGNADLAKQLEKVAKENSPALGQ
jgi:uncharacterized protein